MIIANIIDRHDPFAGIVIDRESERNAAAARASMGLQASQEDLSGGHAEVLVRALVEDADVVDAVQELAGTGGAAARILDGDLDEGVDDALVAEETALAVDAEGPGV